MKLVSKKQEMAEENQKKKETLKVECAYEEERHWRDKRWPSWMHIQVGSGVTEWVRLVRVVLG
jgi:hypothetical protein